MAEMSKDKEPEGHDEFANNSDVRAPSSQPIHENMGDSSKGTFPFHAGLHPQQSYGYLASANFQPKISAGFQNFAQSPAVSRGSPSGGSLPSGMLPMFATGDGFAIPFDVPGKDAMSKDWFPSTKLISDYKQMENYIAQLKVANILPMGCGECYYVIPNHMPNGIQCISVNVSPAGLLTVFLANEISVEMTLDHTVRLVNHRHHSVGSATSLGDLSCICHCSGQMYNEGTTTEVMLVYDRKIKMAPNDFIFSSASEVYSVRDHKLSIGDPDFRDLHSDMTITLLYSSGGYGPHLANQLASIAKCTSHLIDVAGVVTLRVNEVVIQQRPDGDVVVRYGNNFLRTSATNGAIRVDTTLAEMSIDGTWVAQVHREDCKMRAALDTLALSDHLYEFGFMPNRKVYLRPIAAQTETIILNGNRVDENKDRPVKSPPKVGSDTVVFSGTPPRPFNRRRMIGGRDGSVQAPLERSDIMLTRDKFITPPRFKQFVPPRFVGKPPETGGNVPDECAAEQMTDCGANGNPYQSA